METHALTSMTAGSNGWRLRRGPRDRWAGPALAVVLAAWSSCAFAQTAAEPPPPADAQGPVTTHPTQSAPADSGPSAPAPADAASPPADAGPAPAPADAASANASVASPSVLNAAPSPSSDTPSGSDTPAGAPATPAASPASDTAPAPASAPVTTPGPAADSAPAPATSLAPAPVAVQSEQLDKLDLFSTGRETGLGQDLWKGSSADIARAVIPSLAVRPLSPAGVALARRVLAQAATAPAGAGNDADLAAARARALLALGEAKLTDAILDHTPGLADNALLSQTAAEAALINGQDDKACAIGDALGEGRDGLYWLKLRAYCQAVAGKTGAAQLTVTLALQQGKDPVFARLMGALITPGTPAGAASLRDGLDLALSRRLTLDLTAAKADAPPAIEDALEQAAPPPVAPASLSEPDVLAPLHAARSFPAFVIAAKAAAPTLAALVQAKSPMTAPVLEASAALAAGDLDTAQAIRAGMTGDTIPGAGPGDLPILDAALAAAAGKSDAATLDKLCELGAAEGKVHGPHAPRPRAQDAAAIFAALGGDMSDTARAELFGFDLGRSAAPAGRLLSLQAAVHPGEVAMVALSVAETGGVAGPGAFDRAQIIIALARAGLKPDAQTFAVEGLLSLEPR